LASLSQYRPLAEGSLFGPEVIIVVTAASYVVTEPRDIHREPIVSNRDQLPVASSLVLKTFRTVATSGS